MIMEKPSRFVLVIALAIAAVTWRTVVVTHAQDSSDHNRAHNSGTGVGGTASSGTGVRTGQSPLSQPIPPATSTINPQQNFQQAPQRPQNFRGPAMTYPSQHPFGT